LNEKLRDESIEVPVPIWPKPVDWADPVPSIETMESSTEVEEADEVVGSSTFKLPSMANLKSVIVATLRYGRLSAVVESTQLAYSIYSEKELGPPQEVDIDCMKELMKIVNESETNSDWASQHAVWVLTSMSLNKEYCEKMLATGELGIEFLRAIFALGVPGSFSTQSMRCKCVELFNNLLDTNPDYVYHDLGEGNVNTWKSSEFVREVLRKG
jgi:hypothetical protein